MNITPEIECDYCLADLTSEITYRDGEFRICGDCFDSTLHDASDVPPVAITTPALALDAIADQVATIRRDTETLAESLREILNSLKSSPRILD